MRKVSAVLERWGGYLLAIILVVLSYVYRDIIFGCKEFQAFVDYIFQFSSITVGVLGVLLSLFISLSDKKYIKEFFESIRGAYGERGKFIVGSYISSPFVWGLLLILLSCVSIYTQWIGVNLLYMAAFAIYTFDLIRICNILLILCRKSFA